MNNKGREVIIGITIVVVIALMWFARFIPFGELSGMAAPDTGLYYVTPALYFFSSVAQTMGAILGLALAAMYAIMPNIRSSKDNPAFVSQQGDSCKGTRCSTSQLTQDFINQYFIYINQENSKSNTQSMMQKRYTKLTV